MKSRKFGFCAAVLTFFLCLWGVNIARSAEPIKIGAILVLSGPFIEVGVEEKRGIDLAVEELNAKGGILGRKIEVIYEDEQLKPAVGVDKLTKLMQMDKVDFIVGGYSSATGLAVAREMPKYKKICIMTVPATEEITGKYCNRYVFRTSSNSAMEAISGAVFAKDKPYKKFFMLAADYNFGHTTCDIFKKKIKELKPEAEIVGEVYPPLMAKDFAPYISKVLQANPDALWLPLWGADFITFLKQGLQFGLQKKVQVIAQFGGYPFYIGPAGYEASDGIYGGGRYMFGLNTPENNAWVERWYKKYNRYPDNGCLSYNGVMMLMEAVKKAGTIETEAVIKTFETIQYRSPKGLVTMRKCDHQADQDYFWGKVGRVAKYNFPYVNEVLITPAQTISVPCEETGCKME